VDQLGERCPRSGDDVGDDAHRGRRHERGGERQESERPVRLPRRIGEADGERRTERTEMSSEVRAGSGRFAEHECRQALDQHHHSDPRERRAQPTSASEAGRSGSGGDRGDEARHRFGGTDADQPIDALHVGCVPLTGDAVDEVGIGECEIVARGLTVGAGGQRLAGGLAIDRLHGGDSRRSDSDGSRASRRKLTMVTSGSA